MDWNTRYSESGFAYGTNANTFLDSVSQQLIPGDCLSLAEGEGRNAVYLAKHGHTVTAVDASDVGLQKANKLAVEHNVSIKTIHSDLNEYSIPENSFDTIISIFCHIPVGIRQKIHREVITGLKPDGLFVLEAYTNEQIQLGTGGPPTTELLMNLKSLQQELEGLEFIIAQEIKRDVVEGKYHTGEGAVVQVLARKKA